MGKCCSKQTLHTSDLYCGSSDYTTITERGFHSLENYVGQSESKKNSKKEKDTETKGTSMSFGFKKVIGHNGSQNNNKKNKVKEKPPRKENHPVATVFTNPGVAGSTDFKHDDNSQYHESGSVDSLDECGQSNGRTTPRLQPPKKDSFGTACRSNRFGFRQSNIVRPASVGLSPKITDYSSVVNNNVIDKQRSRSAFSSRSVTPISGERQTERQKLDNTEINTNVKNERIDSIKKLSRFSQRADQPNVLSETENNYTVINSKFHTNSIVSPKPQKVAQSSESLVSKFTLHTASLPRPQYPVPISLTSLSVPAAGMDAKIAKQAMNNCRRSNQMPREISADSGVGSIDGCYMGHNIKYSPQRVKNRSRNLEMVISSRHKFEVRDLDDSLSDESVAPLSLPKLPSAFNSSNQTTLLSGLVRDDSYENMLKSPNDNNKSFEVLSLASSTTSITEEKVLRDNSTSEKRLKHDIASENYMSQSKHSSPASSRASWGHGGESMAFKDCSSLSLSSNSSREQHNGDHNKIHDEDITPIANTDDSTTAVASASVEGMFLSYDGNKFAEMATSVAMLDDETSPTDSLVSSTSDEISKRTKKKHQSSDVLLKKNIQISQELLCLSPKSPLSPSHASDSLSISEMGRDFLIDDEIADQPELCFGDGSDMMSTCTQPHSNVETLKESAMSVTPQSHNRNNNFKSASINSYAPQIKPRHSLLTKTESLDTLSPCDSIASDDMMLDFDCVGDSMDSIDRMTISNQSRSASALHETQIWSELESASNNLMREWSSLLRPTNEIRPQLPTRARLLNRSRISSIHDAGDGFGSESSRSPIDSLLKRSLPRLPHRSGHHHLLTSRYQTPSPDEYVFLDKSVRNSILEDCIDFKNQLLNVRRFLMEENEDHSTGTDTLNPFETINGNSITPSEHSTYTDDSGKIDANSNSATTLSNEQGQELADLRRQVVYLQSLVDDRDRTIRIQQGKIEQLQSSQQITHAEDTEKISKTVNSATQTERLRPVSMIHESFVRNEIKASSSTSSIVAACPVQYYGTSRRLLTETPRNWILS